VTDERRGRVILLNGPSSAGKSSIGEALVALLAEPWFLVPVDAFGAMRSEVGGGQPDDAEVKALLTRTRRGYHRAVRGLASAGNDVVMDYPLSEPWRLADLLTVLDGYDVTLVHVRCDPEELQRREAARRDRPVGLALSQTVFIHGDADLTVDTTTREPAQCAAQIAAALPNLKHPKAFERLRQKGLVELAD
jgi:chloramphenicol 3-O phosphotransferase